MTKKTTKTQSREHNPFEIKAAGENRAELLIYGDIGESWWSESITAKEVAEELQGLDVDDIDVYINSYGGSVADGLAIYNALVRHKASVTVHIDGVAISIASLIAMSGDTVKMGESALFMMHAPWSGAVGNAKELREFADVLDTYAAAMSSAYMRKTGKTKDEIMDLLTDGVDHYYTTDEALSEGFIDEVTKGLAAAASGLDKSVFMAGVLSKQANLFNQTAAQVAAIQPKEEVTMTTKAASEKATETPVAVDEKLIKAEHEREVKAAEKKRKLDLRASFSPFLARDGVRDLLDKCIDDDNITVEAGREKLLAKLGEGAESLGSDPKVEVTKDEGDKRIEAAGNVLMFRAGVHRMSGNGVSAMSIDLNGNPFRSSTLLDIAKACVRASGKNPDHMSKREVVSMAFQTTSDFPVILENVIHKTLLAAYQTAPDTWTRFCKIGSVSDFRAHNRYRTGSIGNIDSLGEHGELKTKTIPDGEKETISAATKGNIIGITRDAIINDDMEALTGLARDLGRGYKRTIEAAVYSLLAENSNLGPTMNDGNTLFHASHNNIGTGAAISMVAIEADRVLMASQMDVGANDYLDIRPAKLLIPISLGGTARTINEAKYDPDTANKLQKPNQVNGLFDDIIDTPRLSGTRRYLFADPNDAPVIEVVFLDGQQEPYIETKSGWHSAGAEIRVLGDFGTDAIDYRGAVTNAGA